jgi:hypothetical protein
MRFIGYTLEAAIADIIDNSISAKATSVRVSFDASNDPILTILDDGCGMTGSELLIAMRHGSKNPAEARTEGDLGRYGLGLKTASLSQCRKLTVVSLKDGTLSGLCWDLDIIQETGQWTLMQLEDQDLKKLPALDMLLNQRSGTIVIWSNLDRVTEGSTSVAKSFDNRMNDVANHLSLVFHRYMDSRSVGHKLSIRINERALAAMDPFLRSSTKTQGLPEDSFFIDGHKIVVKPFILPSEGKLGREEIVLLGGKESLRNAQGFYIYRNRRLIVWGDWFSLTKKDELGKLARVRVDIPTNLDRLWTVDVKKSTAFPPEEVRRNLRRTVEHIRKASGNVLTYRGRKLTSKGICTVWNEIADRDGFRYEINRDHPMVAKIMQQVPEEISANLRHLLGVVEKSFPCDAIHSR